MWLGRCWVQWAGIRTALWEHDLLLGLGQWPDWRSQGWLVPGSCPSWALLLSVSELLCAGLAITFHAVPSYGTHRITLGHSVVRSPWKIDKGGMGKLQPAAVICKLVSLIVNFVSFWLGYDVRYLVKHSWVFL